jgi:hypothetical protein
VTIPVEMAASDSGDALEQALSGRARGQRGFGHGDTLGQHGRSASLWHGCDAWQCHPGQSVRARRVAV